MKKKWDKRLNERTYEKRRKEESTRVIQGEKIKIKTVEKEEERERGRHKK